MFPSVRFFETHSSNLIHTDMATLTAERPKPDYNCSQAELYAGLDITWNSQAKYEAEFMDESTRYTAGLSATRKAAIEAARALPDGASRYADSRILHIDLEKKLMAALSKWNSLEGYIKNGFAAEYYSTRISEAGKGFYSEAGDKDWEKAKELLKEGKNFIAAHSAVLLADGGMPATFPAAFDLAKTQFETVYAQFMTAREDAQEQTDAKILANNNIYKDGRAMMKDGKHIFRKQASVRERFIWKRIRAMVSLVVSPGPVEEGVGVM